MRRRLGATDHAGLIVTTASSSKASMSISSSSPYEMLPGAPTVKVYSPSDIITVVPTTSTRKTISPSGWSMVRTEPVWTRTWHFASRHASYRAPSLAFGRASGSGSDDGGSDDGVGVGVGLGDDVITLALGDGDSTVFEVSTGLGGVSVGVQPAARRATRTTVERLRGVMWPWWWSRRGTPPGFARCHRMWPSNGGRKGRGMTGHTGPKHLGLFDEEKAETRHAIESLDQIYEHAEHIRKTVHYYA